MIKKPLKIVVFDLDETLGYFTEFGIFCDCLNKYFKTNLVETDHLLMAILRDEDNVATQILEKYQVYYDLIKEMEAIVNSGTRLNINYWIDEVLDEDQQEEIYDYFMEAESDKIQDALDEFDGDYDEEELRLMRIKFINEVAN